MTIETIVNRAHAHARLLDQLVEKFWCGEGTPQEIDEAYVHARAASSYLLSLREMSRQTYRKPPTTREATKLED